MNTGLVIRFLTFIVKYPFKQVTDVQAILFNHITNSLFYFQSYHI